MAETITSGGVDYAAADYRLMIGSAIVALIGLVIITVLSAKKVKGAMILGILAATVVGVPLGVTKFSGFSMNIGQQMSDFVEVSLFKIDFAGMVEHSGGAGGAFFTIFMLVLAFALVNMFDTIGTLLGTAKQAGMLDENGEMPRMKQAMMRCWMKTGKCPG